MLTMLLGGLWHGASWTFVVWGALHGLYLCVERFWKARIARKHATIEMLPEADSRQVIARASIVPSVFKSNKLNQFLLALLTFFLVNVTWVFFRSNNFGTAWRLLTSMFGQADNGIAVLPTLDIIRVSFITILLVATHWIMRNTTVWQQAQKMKWWIVSIIWSLMIILLILSQKSSDSFIYFQF
jgi:alginate O-acetyltransferase complex protein AlgI